MPPQPQQSASVPSKSGSKVTVACKLPHGLFLKIYEMAGSSEPVMGGGSREVKKAKQIGGQIRVNGNAVPFGKSPKFVIGEDGYALTSGIDADFWAKWLEQNKDSDIVVNNLIFAHESKDHVVGLAEECADQKNGLEPLDPDNLPVKDIKAA